MMTLTLGVEPNGKSPERLVRIYYVLTVMIVLCLAVIVSLHSSEVVVGFFLLFLHLFCKVTGAEQTTGAKAKIP